MAIDYRIAVDWDADGYYHHHLDGDDASEPLNQLAENQADIAAWGNAYTTTGGAALATGTPTTSQVAYQYGLRYLAWTTGTTAGANIVIGYTAPDPEIDLSLSTQYTVVVWLYSPNASYDAIDLRLQMLADNGGAGLTTLATGSAFNILAANGWTQQTLTFTSDATYTNHTLRVSRINSTSSGQFYISGLMFVAGATAPTKFNAGDSSNFYDSLWARTMDARWRLGFNDYILRQVVAPQGELVVKLVNTDKVFTPEYSSSPLYQSFYNHESVVECSTDGGSTWVRMWTGFTQDVVPSLGGQYGEKTAVLTCTDRRRFLDGKHVRIALQESKTTKQIVDAILAEVDWPDGSTPTASASWNTGTTFTYAGDNWDEGTDLLRALTDVCGGDGYHFWWNRSGNARIWQMDAMVLIGGGTPGPASYTIDNTYLAGSLQYEYGSPLVKNVEVAVYPRKIRPTSAPYDRQLWELAYNVDVPNGQTVEIIARYTNEQEDRTIGARNVTISGLTSSPSVALVTSVTEKAQSAVISIQNSSGSDTTVTAMTLIGQKIISFDAVYVRVENSSGSADASGEEVYLDYKVTDDVDRAETIAGYYIALYVSKEGRVKRFSIDAHKNSTFEGMAVNCENGTRINVIDDELEHDGDYAVIGEEHKLTFPNSENVKHVVTYTIERRDL